MKYMIWNNKGGVGKTFITYVIASEYAKKRPEVDVVVADLCPQANVSEVLLGGNESGKDNLNTYHEKQISIASYIKSRYDGSRFGKTGTELDYFVRVHDHNKHIPSNLFLLPGDIDLDICSTIINYLSQAPEKNAWVKSRRFLCDLVESVENDRHQKNREVVFFFDCNPSFANYTEMAVIAANRLIIPCTADSASLRGIYNLFRMIYGVHIEDDGFKLAEDGVFDTFVTKAKENGIDLPKVHLFVQNKSRSFDKKAAVAFSAHIDRIESIVQETKDRQPTLFSDNKEPILNLKDGNTLATVINYEGLLLSDMKHGSHDIYGKKTQTNKQQIDGLLTDVRKCIDVL